MFLTRRRRQAIALAAREQMNAAHATLQRNVYRDHGRRMAEAIQEINVAWATPPTGPHMAPWSPQETEAVQAAILKAVQIARMARDYDSLQTTTDPTIQENRP